ncbi:MAG TPA: hypothetical protein VNM22_03770 [Candidatus Limnocylindrales bacterium]|nr:hypothetical protein [Candidatus Limnocylindrales bacterium]
MNDKKNEKPKENEDSESMEFEISDEDYLKDLDILNTLEKDQEENPDKDLDILNALEKDREETKVLDEMMTMTDEEIMKMADIDLDLDQEDSEVQKILENLDKESFMTSLEEIEKAGETLSFVQDKAENIGEEFPSISEELDSEQVVPLVKEAGSLSKDLTEPPEGGMEDNSQLDEATRLVEKELARGMEESSLEAESELEGAVTMMAKDFVLPLGEGSLEEKDALPSDEADILMEKELPHDLEEGSGGRVIQPEEDLLVEEELPQEMAESALGGHSSLEEVDILAEKELTQELEESSLLKEGLSGEEWAETGDILLESPPQEESQQAGRVIDLDRIAEEEKVEVPGVGFLETQIITQDKQPETVEVSPVGSEKERLEKSRGPETSEPAPMDISPRTSDVDLRLSDVQMAKFKDLIRNAETLQGYIQKLEEIRDQVKEKVYHKLLTEYQTRRANIFKDPEFIQMQQSAKEDLDDSKAKKEEFDLKLEELKDDLEEIKVRHMVGEYSDEVLLEKEEAKKNEIKSWSDRIAKIESTIAFYLDLLKAEGLKGISLLEEMSRYTEQKEPEQTEKQGISAGVSSDGSYEGEGDEVWVDISSHIPSLEDLSSEEEMPEEIDLSAVAMVNCDRCGKATPAKEKFCLKCGAKLKR